ncbi:YfjI family protein [Paraburkholderia graminis]|uniref:YfjI family protein n=1 Tax=Paraburkholderia graminis TaxID=60548 RepID=UPI0038BAE744
MSTLIAPSPYPLSKFHLVIKDAAEEVVRHVQAPDALVGMEFLTNMSASAQGLYDVRLPTGQKRPLSLNLLVIAESGERKTAVHNLVAKPLYVFDESRMVRYTAEADEHEIQMGIWKAVDTGLRHQITRLTRDGKPIDEVRQELTGHAAVMPVKPRSRRIMRQNVTDRSTMDALEGDGESVAFMSDEGEVIIKGGALKQTGVLNKAWDGAQMLTLDRSNGVSVVVRNPRVTVSYMVQPKVFDALLARRGDIMRGSGHWARYLIGYPPSTQGTRFAYQLDIEWCHLPKFHARMAELLDEFGRRTDAGVTERMTLEFSVDAIARWIDLANQAESMLSPWGYLHDIKDFASKLLEIASRVAALLHVFSEQEGKISVDTLNRAIDIVEWHMHEFKRIFSPELSLPQELADAKKLENYLHLQFWSQGLNYAQKNLVLRNGPVRPASRLNAALTYMEEMNQVCFAEGRKGERYIQLNPNHFMMVGSSFNSIPGGFQLIW